MQILFLCCNALVVTKLQIEQTNIVDVSFSNLCKLIVVSLAFSNISYKDMCVVKYF